MNIIIAAAQNAQSNVMTWLHWLEAVNYIAIILLTLLALIYAIKSYKYQSKESYDILCRLNVLDKAANGNFVCGLEVYNNGNKVAKNIELLFENKHIVYIDYIKPEETFKFPVGLYSQSINGTTHNTGAHMTLPIYQGKNLELVFKIDGKSKGISVNTDIIFEYDYVGGNSNRDIERAIKEVSNSVKGLKGRL